MNPHAHDPDEEDVANAESLFADDPPGHSAPRPRHDAGKAAPVEGYDIEGLPPDDDEPDPIPRAPIAPRRTKAPRPEPDVADVGTRSGPEARVDEVWSRWGEWGPTLIRLAAVIAAVIVLTYIAASIVGFGSAFLVLVVGLLVVVVLSYPIAVTLERPVRMTPEHAVKDYFASAAHHFPQYRRMWTLLSSTGKNDREFGSFGEFQAYWKRRMAALRGDSVKSTVPLAFEVSDFRSEKSGGKTSMDAKYVVTVRPRGESTEPLATVRISSSLVRGPDGMWYLNSGILPEPSL